MSEDEYGRRPGSLPDGVHRPRPGLARWVRTLAAGACLLGGLVFVVRGAIDGDALWLWLGVAAMVIGLSGVFVAQWMFRRKL